MVIIILASLLALPLSASALEIWWNATYVENVNPDGLFPRRVIGVNGTWPPPPIEVSRDESLTVHLINGLDVPTALHHHGNFFNSTSWYDGAAQVTQCAIPPGYTYTYEVPLASQWGTYWAHSHFAGQYVDGFRTPMVIRNTPEAHAYDDEFTVVLGDWYHQEHGQLMKHFMSQYNPSGAEPVPESGLMYFSHKGAYLPGFNEGASLPFEAGKTYRLRIVNTAALAMFHFYIEGHQMRIIEADGTDTQEYPVDYVSVSVAQRYSVLVTALNTTQNNFVVHANMDPAMFDVVPDALKLNLTSTVRYADSAPLASTHELEAYDMFDDTRLSPLVAEAQAPADVSIDLNVFFDTYDDGVPRASFNNITYNMPKTPTLFSALTMGEAATNEHIYGPLSFVLKHGDNVQLRIFNWDAGFHPFHLHGHKFQVVHKSMDVTSSDETINPPLIEGQANPMRRDTVVVPPTGVADVRFRANNPGVWLFHCHIEWHLQQGLAVTFIEAPMEMQALPRPPAYVAEQCAALKTPSSGNAAGRNSTTDLRGLTVGPYPQKLGWRAKGIVALAGCILSALLGIATIVWYAFYGPQITDEEHEREVREARAAKEK